MRGMLLMAAGCLGLVLNGPAAFSQVSAVPPAKPDLPSAAPGAPAAEDPLGPLIGSEGAATDLLADQPAEVPLDPLLDGLAPAGAVPAMPYAPSSTPETGMPGPQRDLPVYLVARLSDGGPALTDGVAWRVYSDRPGDDGKLELVATAKGGDADFRLTPGNYLVHTAYGFAGRTTRIAVGGQPTSQTILLNAGGMKLDAEFAGHQPIKTGKVVFDIYEREFDNRGERRIVARNIAPGAIVRLNADTYHVVSRYGSVNATVRADIHVEPGKLTEATVYHNAARVTLKLVNQPGGEAIANTAWSILTPGGDVVAEGNGAFPSFVLANGEYQVFARNNAAIYSREFNVETGRHGEVEVLARDPLSN